jgi:excisionase family DNA binding protein
MPDSRLNSDIAQITTKASERRRPSTPATAETEGRITRASSCPFLSVEQVAKRWSVSERTIRRQVKNRLLAAVRVGKQLRFDPAVIEAYERRRGTE